MTITIADLQAMKGREKIVTLSLYTRPMAQLCDPYSDIILVGDSLGMVLYGFDSTTKVTLDMMIQHGRAVAPALTHALSVIDMPFGSVENNIADAIKNCRRVLDETGATAVKIEGGQTMAKTIAAIVAEKIPVMGHVGLLPQQAATAGGFKAKGLDRADWPVIMADARAVAQAGAFSMVIEAVAEGLGAEITRAVGVPTIGIGAGADCDGQVLVADDMIGLTRHRQKPPKFLRAFGDVASEIKTASQKFAAAVKNGDYPNATESYKEKSS